MMVQMKEKLKNFSAPLVKIFRSKGCQILFLFFGEQRMLLSPEKMKFQGYSCTILLINSVKIANGKKRARQVKGRGS